MIKRATSSKPLNRAQCDDVIDLVSQGKARLTKEFRDGKTQYDAYSVSGIPIGSPHKNFAYLFELAMVRHGNRDGLFADFSQTAGGVDGGIR